MSSEKSSRLVCPLGKWGHVYELSQSQHHWYSFFRITNVAGFLLAVLPMRHLIERYVWFSIESVWLVGVGIMLVSLFAMMKVAERGPIVAASDDIVETLSGNYRNGKPVSVVAWYLEYSRFVVCVGGGLMYL